MTRMPATVLIMSTTALAASVTVIVVVAVVVTVANGQESGHMVTTNWFVPLSPANWWTTIEAGSISKPSRISE